MQSFNAEAWYNRVWRPAMSLQYMAVCLFDFMLAPIFLAWFQWVTKTPYTVWVPLTLQGGGLYHIAMGAIVTATSWGRTKEKLNKEILTNTEDNTK